MNVEFKEVEYQYVAERLVYNDAFDLFFYIDDGDLVPLKSFKDFAEIFANGLKVYKQAVKSY